MTMAAAMTLPTDGTTATAGHLPAALLADGLGESGHGSRRPRDVKMASHCVRLRDESLDTTRAFVRRTLRAWCIDGLTDDLALVVTELVTNALRHGVSARGGTASVDVSLYGTDKRLMCAVSDPSDDVPVRMTPDLARSSGRGLQIVEALSMYWGWTALPRDDGSGGKSVWAVFTLDGLQPEPARVG
jgi:anti-sigma regulatory factor (Ser/Thr protein kinase)